jgi:hypothetical protein
VGDGTHKLALDIRTRGLLLLGMSNVLSAYGKRCKHRQINEALNSYGF